MDKLARDIMTTDPACCAPSTPVQEIARLMVQRNVGEIPILDESNRPVGVVTDRDIVCRVVARGGTGDGHTAASIMSSPVISVAGSATIEDAMAAMETHQIRRVLVLDDGGCCAGIIAQADIAVGESPRRAGELVREVSQDTGASSR
jgi:CBS domain-containing protein